MSTKPPSKVNKALTETETLLAMLFYGIAGTMARKGLVSLLGFEGFYNLWPNFTGCVLIAFSPYVFSSEHSNIFNTGFCGAITTFSQLITQDVFLASVSPQPNWPNYGYGVPMFMARLILHLCCCFAGYIFGKHLGRLHNYLGIPKPSTAKESVFTKLLCLLGIAAWVVCLVTSITTNSKNRVWPLAGIFAPFGVWLRYYLAKLNSADQTVKLGTFSANIFGTFLSCIFEVCTMLSTTSVLQSQMLSGLSNGFVASLTTISTFIKECSTMKTHHAYFYAIISLFIGYSLAFIIIGSYLWTR